MPSPALGRWHRDSTQIQLLDRVREDYDLNHIIIIILAIARISKNPHCSH